MVCSTSVFPLQFGALDPLIHIPERRGSGLNCASVGAFLLENSYEQFPMSKVPGDLRYNGTHQWVRLEGDIATIGITDFAQEQLGDVVYVELPDVGDQLIAAGEAGGVESVKSASDIYSPVSGEVVDTNAALEDSPEIVNESPYEEGWLFKLRLDGETLPADLLSADEYSALLPAK